MTDYWTRSKTRSSFLEPTRIEMKTRSKHLLIVLIFLLAFINGCGCKPESGMEHPPSEPVPTSAATALPSLMPEPSPTIPPTQTPEFFRPQALLSQQRQPAIQKSLHPHMTGHRQVYELGCEASARCRLAITSASRSTSPPFRPLCRFQTTRITAMLASLPPMPGADPALLTASMPNPSLRLCVPTGCPRWQYAATLEEVRQKLSENKLSSFG